MNFSKQLVLWYEENKRDLPWRNIKDPYKIWLSEIILQQTRVSQGRSYYNKFITHYPTIIDLANANEQEVLKLWQGLGYYSRARNLHFTAKHIANQFNGKFPTTHAEILKLKGIGEYTAAAIVSFAFDLSFPVVDGNVFRVLTRYFGIETPIDSNEGKKIIYSLAHQLIDKKQPAQFNQAIMEFGALQCTPKNPNCSACIFNSSCYALQNNAVGNLPIKQKKIKQRNRYFNYLVFITPQNTTFINKRTTKDIWENLFDFPLVETNKTIEKIEQLTNQEAFFSFSKQTKLYSFIKKISLPKHVLSHQIIYATFWIVKTPTLPKITSNYNEVEIANLTTFPVPILIANFIRSFLTIKDK